MSSVRVAAVVPARMASRRFPGKPLFEIFDLPMVEHVRRRARLCRYFSEVVVATCDLEIAVAIEKHGGKVVLTSAAHPGATDRVAEAATKLDCTHIVNVQGDEILVLPEDLERMVQTMEENPQIPAWNALAPMERVEDFTDPSVVKCVTSVSERILFCSRDLSVFKERWNDGQGPVRKVLGVLGYRKDFVEGYGRLECTPLERLEAIDQSRILEHDLVLQGISFKKGYPGINERREVEEVRRLLKEDPLQQAVLTKVLRG